MADKNMKIDVSLNADQAINEAKRLTNETKNVEKSITDLQATMKNVALVAPMQKVVANFRKAISEITQGDNSPIKMAQAWKTANNQLKGIIGQDVVGRAWKSLESANTPQQIMDAMANIGKEYQRTATYAEESARRIQQADKETMRGSLYKYNRDQSAAAARERAIIQEVTKAEREREEAAKAAAKEEAAANKQSLKSLREIMSAMSASNGILKNFWSSFVRIAKLRLLRGIIRSITNAIKEGTQNLYYYSMALDNADASRFSSTMDSLATSLLYMKNSIGSIVAPLLTSLLPAIQTIINAFVTATNVIAQFFAALGGQAMYTKAKESATTWKQVESSAGGAAAAAEEYKNTILSFDEIHALNDVGGGGGGGGGGAGTPNYADMFEEASISPKIRELVEWLKQNWQDILDIVLAIGIAMQAWKIAQGVLDFFHGLGLLNDANMLGASQLAIGLILTITGVTLATKGGFDIGYEGPDLMNIIKTALGIGLAGAGGALAAKGITALGIATVGTGVGAIFGIAIALVGTIVGFTIGEGKKQREAIIAGLEEYDGQFEAIMKNQNGWIAEEKQAWSDYAAVVARTNYAEGIVNQLDILASKASLTTGEIERAKELIKELNGLGLDGVTAAWDDATGTIQINTQEIYNNIKAIKENAKTEGYKKVLVKAYEDEANALIHMQEAQDLADEAQRNYNIELSKYQPMADAMGITLDELAEKYMFADIYLSEEKYALGQTSLALDKATADYNDATAAVDRTEKALGYETDAVEVSGEVTKDAARVVAGACSGMADSFIGVKTATNNAKGGVNDLNTSAKNLGNTSIGSALSNSIWNISNAAGSAAYNAWDAYNAFARLKNLSGTISIGVDVVTNIARGVLRAGGGFVNGYANGGIIPRFDNGGINSADIFLANENGNAELVGRIGNRTAVANQQQMVDVLTNGVIHGLSSIQGGQSSNIEVNVNVDKQRLAQMVDKGNRALNRRYNVSLA